MAVVAGRQRQGAALELGQRGGTLQDASQSFAAQRLGDGILVGATGRLERVLERVAVLAGDAVQGAGAVEWLVLGGAGGVDRHPGLADGAQPGERLERHAPLGVPRADRVEDAEPCFLGEVLAFAARHVKRPGDAANHRLVEIEQAGLGARGRPAWRRGSGASPRSGSGRAGPCRRRWSCASTLSTRLDDSTGHCDEPACAV